MMMLAPAEQGFGLGLQGKTLILRRLTRFRASRLLRRRLNFPLGFLTTIKTGGSGKKSENFPPLIYGLATSICATNR